MKLFLSKWKISTRPMDCLLLLRPLDKNEQIRPVVKSIPFQQKWHHFSNFKLTSSLPEWIAQEEKCQPLKWPNKYPGSKKELGD